MRMRFTKDEQAQFCHPGQEIEFKDGRTWYTGTVISGHINREHPITTIAVVNTDRRNKFLRVGEEIELSPGKLRLPSA